VSSLDEIVEHPTTAEDAALLLGIDRETVHRMTRRRELPAITVSSQWRSLPSRLKRWMEEQERQLRQPRPRSRTVASLCPRTATTGSLTAGSSTASPPSSQDRRDGRRAHRLARERAMQLMPGYLLDRAGWPTPSPLLHVGPPTWDD
jgi:excisionase family DNA binding protein